MSSKKSTADAVTGKRTIKKYPNRRLYDTSSSSYVALDDIKRLVMDHTPFVVVDAKTGSDITRSILLQIILEAESEGAPILTEPMLANIIRFYGHAMQGFMGTYLEKNVQTFMDVQNQLAETSKDMAPLPMMQSLMGGYVDQSTQAFAHMQEQMQQQLKKQTEHMMDVMGLTRK